MRVLAVDDNPLNIDILIEALGDEFDLRTAQSGPEALRKALDFRPDVVLLDVMMPGIDGYVTCSLLRRELGPRPPKIIMVTAKAMPSERMEGFAAGAEAYITKPFDDVEIVNALRAVARNRE